MQRIGVFVCHCGSNIAATVDVKKVVEIIAKEPGVVHAEDYQYMCSEAGQSRIQEAIREKNLTKEYQYLNNYEPLKKYVEDMKSSGKCNPDFKLGIALAAADFNKQESHI